MRADYQIPCVIHVRQEKSHGIEKEHKYTTCACGFSPPHGGQVPENPPPVPTPVPALDPYAALEGVATYIAFNQCQQARCMPTALVAAPCQPSPAFRNIMGNNSFIGDMCDDKLESSHSHSDVAILCCRQQNTKSLTRAQSEHEDLI